VFLSQNPLGQRINGIFLKHRHLTLIDDRPGIVVLVHDPNRHAGHLLARGQDRSMYTLSIHALAA
jgi:hypothetical protein